MSQTEFRASVSIGKPGPVGRSVRMVGGLLCFYFLSMTISGYEGIVSPHFSVDLSLWVGVVFCLHGFHHVLNIGLGFNLGKWPRWIYLALAFVALVFSFVQYGTFWGPELGVLIFGFLSFVLLMLAPALLLSGIIATPG